MKLKIASICVFMMFANSAQSVLASERPNIVFFFIDDLGWADLGYQGSEFYETPNIDKLAASGMVFTNAYAAAPNCAPSRACLLSGQYSPRHGVYTVGTSRRGKDKDRRLEPTQNTEVLDGKFITWAEVLNQNDYVLASMGKWHLGDDPTTQGFDINVAGKHWGSPSGGGYHSPYKYPNLEQDRPGEYLTDRLTDEAVEFVEANKDKPFFLYLSHYAVHTPIQAKSDVAARYKAKPSGQHQNNANYAAMVESVDDSVGKVLAAVDRLRLTDNTIVVFYSDNGGHSGATSNHPLRGSKGMLYEGGIREPFICRWPGVTTAGAVCQQPIIGVDLYPTFVEMTNSKTPDDYLLDGLSIVPMLKDPSATLPRESIFWHFPCYLEGAGDPSGGPFRTTPAGAIRMGDWKLIEWFESGRLELYNLKNDLGESTVLNESHPEKLRQLHAAMKQWRRDVAAPIPTVLNSKYNPGGSSAGRKKKRKDE
ncbi:MAG: sulfatase [Fuerstiella sp.]